MLFGEVRTVTQPGLSVAIPFVEVKHLSERWLYNSTDAHEIQTKDGERSDRQLHGLADREPARLRARVSGWNGSRRTAIDRVVRDGVREVIGRHTLAEVLKDQRASIMDNHRATRATARAGRNRRGDVRINRTELPPGTEESVYARMKTERERLAKKNRAEGEERARRIRAEADREARVIVANARRDAEIARGAGDAEAARIYGEAYSADPDFYAFVRSLEAYRKTIDGKTTLVLSPDTEFFQYLEGRTE